jgi:6-methylsalicylate decarboxylase
MRELIDVHAHHLPDSYRAALVSAGHGQPDGFPVLPTWSAAEHLALMDRLGIARSMLSISSPGVHLGDGTDPVDLAREVNDEGRRTVVDHPGRFGLFASLPLPDVDAAIAEAGRAYDDLDADGVALLTHVDGTYLGDPDLEPLFDELDRRHARVFLHPTTPVCGDATSLGRPRPMLEFLFDTTRAVVNMVLNGTVARHPNIVVVVPHAGATLPVIADRIARFVPLVVEAGTQVDVLSELGRLHYDLAGTPLPRQLDALLAITSIEHLHYGSDYPFTPDVAVEGLAGALAQVGDPHGALLDTLAANTQRLLTRGHQPIS